MSFTVPLEETSTELKIAYDLMMSEKRQPSVSLVHTQREEVVEEATRDMSPTNEEVSKIFAEKQTVYARSRPSEKKQSNVRLTQSEPVPIEITYTVDTPSSESGHEEEIIIDLSQSTQGAPLPTWVQRVQEQVPEELAQEVQELVEAITEEQHIIVELSKPTKEDAKVTAVEPVQEAVSEESLHELPEVEDEISVEHNTPFELVKSEKKQPEESLVQPQEQDVEPEAARDMSPTHEVSNLFTEKAAVYAQSRQIARKQTRVVMLAEQVPVEGTYEIEAHSEEIGFQQEITVDLGRPSKEKPLQTMVRSVEERVFRRDNARSTRSSRRDKSRTTSLRRTSSIYQGRLLNLQPWSQSRRQYLRKVYLSSQRSWKKSGQRKTFHLS